MKSKLKKYIGCRLDSLGFSLRPRQGATTTEYSLVLALVVIVLITTMRTLGSTLNTKLNTIISSLNAVP